MDKRGPKLGDAASLWNFTPSPGWTKEESLRLKLCLMRYGIGQWVQIQGTGLLPGKLIQQLNGATQRLLGQQSLAAFSGLKVDIDRIRAENEAKTDARRKNGLIIWGGANPTKEMKLQWQQEAKDKYGLTAEQQAEADAAYEEMAAAVEASRAAAAQAAAAEAAATQALPPDCDILECDVQQLSTFEKQQLVCLLHRHLEQLVAAASQSQPQQQQQPQQLAYLQQPRQGWIALGLPLQQAAVGAADSSAARDNLPSRASLLLRQPGVAGRKGDGSSKAASKGAKAGRPPTGAVGRKRGRPPKAAAAAAGGGASAGAGAAGSGDESDDFVQRQPRRARAASSKGGRGGGADSSSLASLMRVALDAGVAQLVEMGYSRSKAEDALRECACDVEAAVEYLTAACC